MIFGDFIFFIKNSDVSWKRIKTILLRECENNAIDNGIFKKLTV
jgi:hypothetical protein